MSCPQDTSLVVSTVNFVVYTDVHHGAFVFLLFSILETFRFEDENENENENDNEI